MSITEIRLIATREVKSRWALCPGALVFGILAMMVTRTLDFDDGGPTDMLLITRIIGFLAAGMIGLSLLGDQLTDGRLSFYFARPFTPRAIFAGKLIGGLALALAIHLCLVLPVVLGFPEPPEQDTYAVAGPVFGVVTLEMLMGVAVCVAFGMAAGIVVRSRTRWLVLDVLGVGSFLVLVSWVVLHVGTTAQHIAGRELGTYFCKLSVLIAGWLVAVLAMLVYATAKALSRGRIDREIAHAALSKTLWPLALPFGGAIVVAVLVWL